MCPVLLTMRLTRFHRLDHRYSAYKELLQRQPSLKRIFESETHILSLGGIFKDVRRFKLHTFFELTMQTPQLNKGADSARGDDTASLKLAVVHWLTEAYPDAQPRLEPDEKTGRGFNHDLTGHLLCPVDYNWEDDQ